MRARLALALCLAPALAVAQDVRSPRGVQPGDDATLGSLAVTKDTGTGPFTALALENLSVANNSGKSVLLQFYGRDTANNRKPAASLAAVPADPNYVNVDALIQARAGDALVDRVRIKASGHIVPLGPAPTLSSCGTAPTVAGTDVAGLITTGTGATACTLVFAAVYANTPFCVVSGQSAAVTYLVNGAGIAITAGASAKINYHCFAADAGG